MVRAAVNAAVGFAAMATALLLAGSRVGAQRPAPQQPRFTVRTDAVQVDVLVTHKGRTVSGLTADDFEVRDEGVLQRVEVVAAEASPLNIIYVVSTGGGGARESLRAKLATSNVRILVRAVEASLQTLRADDRVAFLSFYSRCTPRWPSEESAPSSCAMKRARGSSSTIAGEPLT